MDIMRPSSLAGLIQIGDLGTLLGKLVQQIPADVGVRHLPAAEADGDLHPVAIGDELLGVFQLRVEVSRRRCPGTSGFP